MLRHFPVQSAKREREREWNREGATKSAVVGAYEWRDSAVRRSWLESMENPTDWLTGHCLLASEHNRKQIKLLLPIMHTNLCTHGNGKHHLPPLAFAFVYFALIFQAKMVKLLARGVAASCVCEICNNSVKKHEGSGPRLACLFMKSGSHTQREMYFRVRRRLASTSGWNAENLKLAAKCCETT